MAAVRVFYMRVMNDEMLRPFFEDIDLARLKNKLVSRAQQHSETEVYKLRLECGNDHNNVVNAMHGAELYGHLYTLLFWPRIAPPPDIQVQPNALQV